MRAEEVTTQDIQAVFDRFVVRKDGCWGWRGRSIRAGYPLIKVGWPSLCLRANRASWMLAFGDIPDGQCVLHHCDNALCTNPDHLFLGTQADNVADMVRKGRSAHQRDPSGSFLPRGSEHGMSKLTAEQVLMIRELVGVVPGTELAKRFHISRAYVGHIARRRVWRHV